MKPRTTFNRNFIKYWLPVVFWMCFILWMSTETFSSRNTSALVETILPLLIPEISSQELALIHVFMRKLGHFIEYFILGILFFRAFRGGSTASCSWRWYFFAVTLIVLWAASDEFHQSFVPTRTASIVDVGIDTAGGILAQFVNGWWHRCRKK